MAGQAITVSAPTGQLMQAVVPIGLAAGDKFIVSMPMAAGAAQKSTIPTALPTATEFSDSTQTTAVAPERWSAARPDGIEATSAVGWLAGH